MTLLWCAGLYGAGLLMLYCFVKASVMGLMRSRAAGGGGYSSTPSRAWQLDLLVTQGVVFSLVGVYVVHCLGAAWLVWLCGWLLWCGCQLFLNMRLLSHVRGILLMLLVALVLPALTAVLPFHHEGFAVQAALLEAFPFLNHIRMLDRLLGRVWRLHI